MAQSFDAVSLASKTAGGSVAEMTVREREAKYTV